MNLKWDVDPSYKPPCEKCEQLCCKIFQVVKNNWKIKKEFDKQCLDLGTDWLCKIYSQRVAKWLDVCEKYNKHKAPYLFIKN